MAVTEATVVAVAACAWASGAVVAGGDDRLYAEITDASGPIPLLRALPALMNAVPC
jgi:hypothetical protein